MVSVSSSLCRLFSLNQLQCVRNESLEAVNQVTHLDLRDNCLSSLDLSTVCNLEVLHCQRNQLGTLTLSGFTLRTLNGSSNRKLDKDLISCSYTEFIYNIPETERADCCLSLFARRSNNSQRLSSPQPADTHGPITVSCGLEQDADAVVVELKKSDFLLTKGLWAVVEGVFRSDVLIYS